MLWDCNNSSNIALEMVPWHFSSYVYVLTAEGLTPPRAVYKASFPTGIPIPCIIVSCHKQEESYLVQVSNQVFLLHQREVRTRKYNRILRGMITWQPRSPSPKILSPSVTTMTWIDLSGQFLKTSRIFPLHHQKCSLLVQKIQQNKTPNWELTFLLSLYINPGAAWRDSHIFGKLLQQLECTQLGGAPPHYQWVACKTISHFSPINTKFMKRRELNHM